MKKILSVFLILILTFSLIACKKEKVVNNDIYYSLFVRSFADSDGDGIGDLNGVTENLDYLSDLGITGIWLLPIFKSPSYHGYDTTDYYEIQPEYGTMADLDNLIKAAHKRNIKIILDFVINHTSDQHPWFKDQSKKSWYSQYQSFGGGMQDLNLDNQEVVTEINNIAKFYLDKGIDGFRIDAVSHLYEEAGPHLALAKNIIFMNNFKQYIKSVNKNAFIVGEVFVNDYHIINNYVQTDISYFNFYLQSQLQSKIGNGDSRTNLASNIVRNYEQYYQTNRNYIDSPFLSNHDIDRAANLYKSEEKYRQALQILMTLPGNPFIYYGDELGMKGVRYEGEVVAGKVVWDEYRRQPFLWGDDRTTSWLASDGSNDNTLSFLIQKEDENSLFNFTKAMIALRKNNPALRNGLEIYKYEEIRGVQSYLRVINDGKQKQALLVVHNVYDAPVELDIDLKVIYGNKTVPGFSMTIFEIPFKDLEKYK